MNTLGFRIKDIPGHFIWLLPPLNIKNLLTLSPTLTLTLTGAISLILLPFDIVLGTVSYIQGTSGGCPDLRI